jgi:hypothetical protein
MPHSHPAVAMPSKIIHPMGQIGWRVRELVLGSAGSLIFIESETIPGIYRSYRKWYRLACSIDAETRAVIW